MRSPSPRLPRRLIVTSIGAGLILSLVSLVLLAQQTERTATPPTRPAGMSPASDTALTDESALLPTIPLNAAENPPAVMVSRGIIGPIPGELPPDPDNSKHLYGYDGPYYNTSALDGQVKVVDQSLYFWPTSTWKASGMLRNQTRCPIRITGLTARLLGSHGELITTATMVPPVTELRPGEPGPFIIGSSIERSQVKSVKWHIDYVLGTDTPRSFELQVNRQEVQPGTNFFFRATIHNAATITARDVHVVVAWLSIQDNRLLYVTTAKFGFDSDPKDLKRYH